MLHLLLFHFIHFRHTLFIPPFYLLIYCRKSTIFIFIIHLLMLNCNLSSYIHFSPTSSKCLTLSWHFSSSSSSWQHTAKVLTIQSRSTTSKSIGSMRKKLLRSQSSLRSKYRQMDLKMENLKSHQIKLISIASRMQLDTRQQPVWLEVELRQVLEAQQLCQQLVSHQVELQ